MKRLYIEIVGGLVSAVYTDSAEPLDVTVIDRDCSEELGAASCLRYSRLMMTAWLAVETVLLHRHGKP